MEEIRRAQEALEQARRQLGSAVHRARQDGRTWAQIGADLGMSRQAAFKRFGRVTDPADGQEITGAPMSIEQIRRLTEEIFDLIGAGDYESLERRLHPDVRQQLPAALIAETWARVLAEVGAQQSYSDTHVVLPAGERIVEDDRILGTVVGVTTLNCEAGEVMGRVAVDGDQRVVGLLIVPSDYGPVDF